MPHECNNAAVVVVCNGVFHLRRACSISNPTWGVVHHIHTQDSGRLSDVGFDPAKMASLAKQSSLHIENVLVTAKVLLSGNDVLSIFGYDEVVEILSDGIGVAIHKCSFEGMLSQCYSRRDDKIDKGEMHEQ